MRKNSGAETHLPACSLSHLSLNKLSVIIGSCDLLLEPDEGPAELDPNAVKRLELIRSAARDLVEEFRTHVCELEARIAVLSGAALAIDGETVNRKGDPLKTNG